MSMIKRATTGHIVDNGNGAVVCKACSHVVFRVNLGSGGQCPYCHYNVNHKLEKSLFSDLDLDDEEDTSDVIAQPC